MESIKLAMAQIEGALCMLRRGIPKSALPRHVLLLGVHSSQALITCGFRHLLMGSRSELERPRNGLSCEYDIHLAWFTRNRLIRNFLCPVLNLYEVSDIIATT